MFRIESERLIIRPWERKDRRAFTKIMSSRDVTRYIHGGEPFTWDEVDDFMRLQQWHAEKFNVCMGALVEKESASVVGIAGPQPLGSTGDLEIGWILARERWGRGYATEAGAAAMKHVLVTLARPRVVAIIDPGNEPSRRVAARLGMTLEARYTGAQLGHRTPEIVVDLFYRNRE